MLKYHRVKLMHRDAFNLLICSCRCFLSFILIRILSFVFRLSVFLFHLIFYWVSVGCVFWSAFGYCACPKAGGKTFLGHFQTFFKLVLACFSNPTGPPWRSRARCVHWLSKCPRIYEGDPQKEHIKNGNTAIWVVIVSK